MHVLLALDLVTCDQRRKLIQVQRRMYLKPQKSRQLRLDALSTALYPTGETFKAHWLWYCISDINVCPTTHRRGGVADILIRCSIISAECSWWLRCGIVRYQLYGVLSMLTVSLTDHQIAKYTDKFRSDKIYMVSASIARDGMFGQRRVTDIWTNQSQTVRRSVLAGE